MLPSKTRPLKVIAYEVEARLAKCSSIGEMDSTDAETVYDSLGSTAGFSKSPIAQLLSKGCYCLFGIFGFRV